ncbi:MAG: ABC transporter ATP-binding protein [Planctomycetaceae bacterium]|jgi:ABC-2 type transport system ATP-binding protein|nr:ABC transporter ATP-binding protein [bacterium]MDB4786603.1 ABC transporter ATP-binding protein [Planctomycetaceae bacterium]MDC0308398.1 ABC transporter ATP-binding protein [Planctomycetaceae bacterium]MDG2389442.1 ABC transporter ATP-binding protein [Planctomycetaceae bacterium]
MSDPAAISVEALSYSYGERVALSDVSFQVKPEEIFGLLGPNGSGKTTLFRLLCTLMPIQSGAASLSEADVKTSPAEVRRKIGITFQSPSLDDRLTVRENLKHHGHLYGLRGSELAQLIEQLLTHVGLVDRMGETVSKLSGGMKRRVEIAKGLLHRPEILLLDEPSTGLDPGARHDLWQYLRKLRDEQQVTILVTTHLMEEAERCDRLAILNQGELVAMDTPEMLRSSIGGDCITISTSDQNSLQNRLRDQFQLDASIIGNQLRIGRENGHELIRDLVDAFPDDIESISLGKPTLEDVFIQKTGHRFWEDEAVV